MQWNIQQYYPSFYTFYESYFSRVRHPSHPGRGHGSLTCHVTQFERSDWLRSANFINIMIEYSVNRASCSMSHCKQWLKIHTSHLIYQANLMCHKHRANTPLNKRLPTLGTIHLTWTMEWKTVVVFKFAYIYAAYFELSSHHHLFRWLHWHWTNASNITTRATI